MSENHEWRDVNLGGSFGGDELDGIDEGEMARELGSYTRLMSTSEDAFAIDVGGTSRIRKRVRLYREENQELRRRIRQAFKLLEVLESLAERGNLDKEKEP